MSGYNDFIEASCEIWLEGKYLLRVHVVFGKEEEGVK